MFSANFFVCETTQVRETKQHESERQRDQRERDKKHGREKQIDQRLNPPLTREREMPQHEREMLQHE